MKSRSSALATSDVMRTAPATGSCFSRVIRERHLPVVLQIVRQPDSRHAAGVQFALDTVAAGEGGDETHEGVSHPFTCARFNSSVNAGVP